MRTKRFFSSASVVVFLLILFAPTCLAQSAGTSALTGTVTDPTGAVIPGVTITATSLKTNQTRTAKTDEVGVYRLALLEPGAYRVRFSFSGFKTAEVSSVALAVT